MAVTKAYTTEAKIESYLNKTIVAGEADDFINAAVAFIDNITGRNFIADTVASARLFNGNGTSKLCIDDVVEITLVEAGNDSFGDNFTTVTAGGSAGYYTLPNNYSAEGLPIQALFYRDGIFYKGLQNQRVTGKWGFSASVPEDVAFATTVLAGGMYNANRGGGAGNVKSERIGNYSVTYGDNQGWADYESTLVILNNYRIFNF